MASVQQGGPDSQEHKKSIKKNRVPSNPDSLQDGCVNVPACILISLLWGAMKGLE